MQLMVLCWCWCACLWPICAEAARPLRTTATIVPVSTAPSAGKSEWWAEDHPYMYKFRYKRLANGSLVLNQDDDGEKLSLKKIREAAAANRSATTDFLASRKNRKALRSVYQFMLMNFVPPMAHGSVLQQARIKRLQSKMMRNYFVHSIAVPGVKLLGSLLLDAIKLHYGSYIERKMLFKRMETMTLEEICAELNVTPPVYDADAYFEAHRPNYTLPFEPSGFIHAFREYALQFEPYANYSLIYYSRDEDLPPPVLPAASYPWRWRRELAETRDLVLQVMALTAGVQAQETARILDDEGDESSSSSGGSAGSNATPGGSSVLDRHDAGGQDNGSPRKLRVDSTVGSAEDADDNADDDTEFEVVRELESSLREYHFATGIPRIAQQNTSYALFPTLESLLNENASVPALSTNSSSDPRSSAARPSLEARDRAQDAELRRRKGALHDAMVQFYAYPCVDASMALAPHSSADVKANCSVAAPCLVQSGVTVFTPQLSTLRFFKEATVASSSKEQQRRARVQVLQRLAQVAFEAEQKALEAGVQAPSTVWYSLFDYNVDQFADALQGQVRAVQRSKPDGSARDVYTTLVADKQRSLFHAVSSYYWSTLRDTKRALLASKTAPTLEALSETEQIAVLATIAAKMRDLDAAIAAFVEKRTANEEHRQVVNATLSRAEYEGSQYSTLGFGFLLPATNKHNVLYRDLRLPEPFHLALRLLVRVQESRLLLLDESLHVVTCLAMLRSEISYYRCR